MPAGKDNTHTHVLAGKNQKNEEYSNQINFGDMTIQLYISYERTEFSY
jgi:hypothetical protein